MRNDRGETKTQDVDHDTNELRNINTSEHHDAPWCFTVHHGAVVFRCFNLLK